MTSPQEIRVGILTTSDRAAKGEYKDISGKLIIHALRHQIVNPLVIFYKVIPDEKKVIAQSLRRLSDTNRCALIITTGGTGPAKRDVTPEATEEVCEKILPGFGEAMRLASIKSVPTAVLSRQTAGIRKNTLIVNLPGNPKAIEICLDAVFPAFADCLDLIKGPALISRSKKTNIHHHKKEIRHGKHTKS